MAFTIDQIKEYWSNNWRFDNCLGGSTLAVLFPNELQQEGGQLNTVVKFPVMTEATTQKDFKQETGFIETNAHERVVEMKLSRNFTSYTKIAKVNIPGEDWAAKKMTVLETQEAMDYDDCALETICKGTTNHFEAPVKITKENIVAEIKKMEKAAKKKKFLLRNCIILISPEVMTTLIESKLSSVTQNIENTNAIITKILNKYWVVEANVDDYGFQMIAMLPGAYGWASYVETPLSSGEYTQGSFFGQIFTVINKFYNGEVLMPDKILGYLEPGYVPEETETESKNDKNEENSSSESLENYKNMKLDFLTDQFQSNPKFSKYIDKTREIILSAKNAEKVEKAVEWFTKSMN